MCILCKCTQVSSLVASPYPVVYRISKAPVRDPCNAAKYRGTCGHVSDAPIAPLASNSAPAFFFPDVGALLVPSRRNPPRSRPPPLEFRMKGLLSGMSLPSLLSKSPKRHRKSSLGASRKKPRKDSELSLRTYVSVEHVIEEIPKSDEVEEEVQETHEHEKEPESTVVQENLVETPETLEEIRVEEQEPNSRTSARSITYQGDRAIVRLNVKQTVAMDGWAMVSLLQGRASVHGYTLCPGVAVLLCSNSRYSAAVTVEAQCVDGVMTSMQSSGFSKEIDPNITGCTLEFKSYRGVGVESASEVDYHECETANKRTFRLEVPGTARRDAYSDHLIKKRKRQEPARQTFQFDGARDREDLSDGGEDSDDRVSDRETVEDYADMEVDEHQEDSEAVPDDACRRKVQKVAQSPLQETIIPKTWLIAADSISSYSELRCGAPVVTVCGAKGSGKSTFGRFLLNHLLNSYASVGYLDTDVGQPEFTVPGCLSLHILTKPVFGSPILHIQNPERSFFYGDITPKSDPGMYCRSVEALYDYFQQNYGSERSTHNLNDGRPSIPLIINTHGWLKGVGYEVLVSLLRHTSPTHLVHINSIGVNNNLPAGRFWKSSADSETTAILYIENVMESSDKPLSRARAPAAHLRDVRILAYFRQCFWGSPLPYPYRENRLYAQIASKLASCPPYQIPLSAVKICHLHYQVPESERLYSVNGTLVGLGVTLKAEKKYSGGPSALCVGLGIVRGVDPDKGLLFLITPLDVEILQDVDTLMQGWLEVPLPLLQANGYVSPYLCHNSVAIEGTGSVAIKKAHEKFTKSPKRML